MQCNDYLFRAGNHVFNPKEDTDAQSKILTLLLHKSLVPFEKDNPLGKTERKKIIKLNIKYMILGC